MTRLRLCTLTLLVWVLAAFGVAVPQAGAAQDMYLRIEGIEGESTASKHEKQIDILAFSWGATRGVDRRTRSRTILGKVRFQGLSVTKYVDKASPLLMLKAANGSGIPSAELIVAKAGGANGPVDYLFYCFQDVRVDAVSGGGSGGEDRLSENIIFSYGSVAQQYRPQNKDGTLAAGVFAGWDATNNKMLGSYPSCR